MKGLPKAGTIYAFRTSPYSEFAPPETHRYGALKVLGSNKTHTVVAALDSIWSGAPSISEAARRGTLSQHRFAHRGRQAIFGINASAWSLGNLLEMAHLGETSLHEEEVNQALRILNFEAGSVFGTPDSLNYAVEGEWRWANDREAFVAEHDQQTAKNATMRAAQEARYNERLKGLTWEKLLAETPFERWSLSPPFPDQEFTRNARQIVQWTCLNLRELGDKPRKADVRRVLKECVERFNKLDEDAGGAIETEEREDICAILEEMAHVARQEALVAEVDDWRTW